MAELADAADSKSADRKVVGVRPPLPAPIKSTVYRLNASPDSVFCAQSCLVRQPQIFMQIFMLTPSAIPARHRLC